MDPSILVGRGCLEWTYEKFISQVAPPLLKIVIISANNAELGEMLDSAASQLGLYCLPIYFSGVTVPGIQGIKKLSKQLGFKVASNILSLSYSLYCLQS